MNIDLLKVEVAFSPYNLGSSGKHEYCIVNGRFLPAIFLISTTVYWSVVNNVIIIWRCLIIKSTEVNEEIRDREVRLIDENDEQMGIMSAREAYQIAIERKLDLVKVAPQARPPVCRIMDYGKHKYEQSKREKEAKKKQKSIGLKEVRLSLNIEKHDLVTKAKNAIKFLDNGDKLKVTLRFRGRELGHTNLGFDVFDRFAVEIEDHGVLEKRPKMEGRSMVAFYAPKKQ